MYSGGINEITLRVMQKTKELLEKVWQLCAKSKAKRIVTDEVSYYYKTIVISKDGKRIAIFDTSTDIYRPLKNKEIRQLLELGLDKFTNQLSIKNTTESIKLNRNLFHISIAKKSNKEKEFYFRKTMRRIKKLRKLLGYKQKFS